MVTTRTGGVVGVFWDHGTCPPPANVPPHRMVEWIQDIALEYGTIIRFNTYLDVRNDANLPLISDLRSAGVSLIHCGESSHTEAAYRSMTLDLFTFALDCNVPSFVVITQNPNFSPCLAALKRRQHIILLAAPPDSSAVLRAQGSRVFVWNGQSTSEVTPAFDDASACPPLPRVAGSASTLDLIETFRKSTLGPPQFDVNSGGSHPGEELCEQDDEHTHLLEEVVHGLPTDDLPVETHSRSAMTSLLEPDSPIAPATGSALPSSPTTIYASHFGVGHFDDEDTSEDGTDEGHESLSVSMAASKGHRNVQLDAGDMQSLQDDDFGSGRMPGHYDTVQSHVPIWRQYTDMSREGTVCSEESKSAGLAAMFDPESVLDAHESTSTQTRTEDDPTSQVTSMADQVSSSYIANATIAPTPLPCAPRPNIPSSNGFQTASSVARNARFQILIDVLVEFVRNGEATPTPGRVSKQLKKRDKDIYSKAGCAKIKNYLKQAVAADVITLTPKVEGSSRRPTLRPRYLPPDIRSTSSAVPPVSPSVNQGNTVRPQGFHILIDTMRQLTREGVSSPQRRSLGKRLLQKDRKLYKKAGVNGSKKYLGLASNAGIINLEGKGGNTFVTLNPRYA